MNPDRRNGVPNPIQTWVEIINSSTSTKENEMHENTTKLSEKAADMLFGQPTGNDFDRDLYELRKLADRVLEAIAAGGAQDVAFREAKGAMPYNPPKLKFTMPMPSWPE